MSMSLSNQISLLFLTSHHEAVQLAGAAHDIKQLSELCRVSGSHRKSTILELPEIHVREEIQKKALIPIERMLEISSR